MVGTAPKQATYGSYTPLPDEKNNGTTPTPDGEEAPRNKVEQIIEEIGLGAYHVRVILICGLFFFSDIMEVQFLVYLKKDWDTYNRASSWETSLLGFAVFGGMLFGASFWGWIADKYGRKKGLLAVALTVSTFGLVSSFAPNVLALIIFRGCVGFGLGGAHISVTLMMELVPAHRRDAMLTFFQLFNVLGAWVEAALAWGFMDSKGWKVVALLTSVPSFVATLLLYWLPESPLWLVVAQRPKEASSILQTMARTNKANVTINEEKLAGMVDIKDLGHQGNYRQLFAPALWKSTIIVWIIWFSNSMVYYGLILVYQDYLSDWSKKIYRDMFLTTLSELPALVLVAVLIRLFGPKNSQSLFFLGSMALAVAVASSSHAVDSYVVAVIISTLIRFSIAGSFYNCYALTPTIYPTSIRSIGFGAGSSMSRVGGMLTNIVANLGETTSLYIPFAIYGTISAIAGLSAFALNWTTRAAEGREGQPLLGSKKVRVEVM